MDRINRSRPTRNESPFKPATVRVAPVSADDSLGVEVFDRPGEVLYVRGWQPADATLPVIGDHALVVCAADGGWWCIAWTSS